MIDPGPETLTEWPKVAQLLPQSAAAVSPSPGQSCQTVWEGAASPPLKTS